MESGYTFLRIFNPSLSLQSMFTKGPGSEKKSCISVDPKKHSRKGYSRNIECLGNFEDQIRISLGFLVPQQTLKDALSKLLPNNI